MKKLLLSLLFLITLLSMPIVVSAQDCFPRLEGPGCFIDPMNNAQDSNSISIEPMTGVSQDAFIWGTVDKLLPLPDSTGAIRADRWQNSMLGITIQGINLAYMNPPANLALWIQDTGQTLGFLPKKTYAQGLGFNGLLPLLELWKTFRNLAYILLSIAIIIVGFMIMFRRRIDPHTVVTIQNALPRIVIVLITISFSYAIVAVLIELMYVILFASLSLIANTFKVSVVELNQTFIEGSFGDLSKTIFAPLGMFNFEGNLLATGAAGLLGVFGGPIGWLAGGLVYILSTSGAPGGVLSPLFWLIFAIVLVFALFRIFFMLINAYIQVLVSVIFAPIQLLMDVFPGNNAFINWISNIIGNLLTFVIVAIFLSIGGFLTERLGNSNFWEPPIIGRVDGGLFRALLGVGFILMIPPMVNAMKEALKAKTTVPIGFGSAFGNAGAAAGGLLGVASSFYYIAPLARGIKGALNASRGKGIKAEEPTH